MLCVVCVAWVSPLWTIFGQMWSMLDDMHESDPTKYDTFVQKQFDLMEEQKLREDIGTTPQKKEHQPPSPCLSCAPPPPFPVPSLAATVHAPTPRKVSM